MVSRKNIKYKLQQDAKRVPHYGIRKLSVGVASVLLGTVFYMQNGTAHADVNPTVSAGNNSVKVINENSGTDSSIVFSSMSNRAGSANSANSVVSTGGATNSMAVHPVSVSPVSPVESATSQVSHSAVAVSEPGSTTPASQVNSGANVVSNSIPVQNRPASAFMGYLSNGRLASNLKVNPSVLAVSKVASTGASNNAVNGGFDQSTWGTLDVSKWTGQENNGVYELTGYTGDLDHIIVPNSADFAKAGRNVGLVGISADTTHSWFVNGSPESIAFSKTDGQMVKAVGSNWTSAFTGAYDRNGLYMSPSSALTLFDGNNLDTSNITNMRYMFAHNKLTALSGVSNWKTDNVTDMSGMFVSNQISDLTPIVNWNTDNVMDMSFMFDDNQISDLTALANWKTDNVANMSAMFINNQIAYADFTKWDFGKAQKLNQLGEFIYQSTPVIIIVKNADDQTLFSNSQVISTKQNQLHFGSDTEDMPTVYVASDKELARNKILSEINIDLSYYKIFHANADDIKPVEPLDQLTKLVDLANAKFTGVNRTLPELDTNDAFALDPTNGLHEHKNVNDNGGYDTDFWGTLDVSKFTTVKNGDDLEITGYTGDASKVIIPNIADFWTNHLDQGAKQVTISSSVMFSLSQNATRIGLSKTNNQKVVAGDARWSIAFKGYYNKLNLMDLHNLDTINVTDMSGMFSSASKLTNIGDLSQWNTANVTNMSGMFSSASGLTNIGDLSQWNTANVTNMSVMFSSASGLTNIGDLDNWDTSKVTDMDHMFQEASSLTNIGNLSKWDVSNVTNMDAMFQQASSLTNIGDLDNWNTSKVTDMGWMFDQASALTNIGDLSQWNIAKVVEMGFMFSNASALTNIGDLSKWNVSNVFDMNGVFYQASALTNIGDLSKWDVSNVGSMNAMFYQASALKQLNISNWDLTKLTDKEYFQAFVTGDPNLVVIANSIKLPTWYQNELSNSNDFWNDHLAVITNNETLLKATGSVDSVMVDDVSAKRPVFYNSNGSDDAVAVLKQADQDYIKQYQSEHPGDILTLASDVDQTDPIALANAKFVMQRTLPELDTNDAFALDPINGLHEHKNVNDNGGYDTDFWGTLDVSKFTTVKNGDNLEITGYTGDASKVIIPNIADFLVNKLDQGAKQVTISSSVMNALSQNATRIGLSKTNNQKVVAGDANWSNAFGGVNDDGGVWLHSPNLTVMDLHNLDTTKITNMSSMLNDGVNLKVVGDLSQWNTANVANMHAMFKFTLSLTNIGDLDNWNTSKVTDMSHMFDRVSKLTNIGDLSKWDVSNVTDMNSMFNQASSLTNIGDLNNWDTSKVTDMNRMFQEASSLTNIGDLNNWDTSKVTDMNHMFQASSSLINIGDLDNWNTSKVTNMSSMFSDASKLTNIGDLSKWDVSKVTDMSRMFQEASSLINIGDLDNWNTSKVTNMSLMFSDASKLTNIGDLSKWDVSNVTDMHFMFAFASSLTNIGDLNNWNTFKVTDMTSMFDYMTALKQLNISNWDLTKLRDKYAFQSFVNGDPNLVVIANNIKLPTWYQNELGNSNDFWNDHLAVITNNEALLKATGSVDNVTVDNASVTRPIFYDSKGSDDAVAVLKQANQAYVKQYQSEHPGYTLALAVDVDQTDPIALANAKFVSVPLDVQFKLAYYDLTGKLIDATTSTHKVGDMVSISPVAPANYVLANGQAKADYLMRWGLNEADFLVEPKLTQTIETKTVSRTIKVQTPDGQTQNVVQTVKFVRDGYLNQVTKQTIYAPWSFNGQYQFSSYQPKPIDGYTADVASGVIVTPNSSDTMLSLAYHKLAADYFVDYQLANGKVVANVVVTPGSDGRIQLTAPKGYRLLTSVNTLQSGFGSQTLVALVVPNEQTYTVKDTLPSVVKEPLTKTITRTVKITMPNGHVRTVKQSVKFERTATVKADGTVVYSNWQALGRAQFNRVFLPKRHCYHLVITDASCKVLADVAKVNNVTAEMDDEAVSVKYVKD